MSRATRLLLVAAMLEVIALPFATAHVLAHEDSIARSPFGPAVEDAGATTVVMLILVAALPLLLLLRAARRWREGHARLLAILSPGDLQDGHGVQYKRIAGREVMFCTAGLLRPTIFATAGAERRLPPGPFRAALLHEQAHLRHRDTLWLALISVLERAFSLLPWSTETFRMIRFQIERTADNDALAAGATRADLFEAIVAASAPATGAALSEVGVLQRLRWLAGAEPPTLRWGNRINALLGSLAVPPAIAHALLWTEIVCASCFTHFVTHFAL